MLILAQRKLMPLITATVILVFLTNCAANGHRGFAQGDDDCSAAKSAGAGALIGGLIGAAVNGREGAMKGAAAGAVVGGLGCIAMNYHTKKVRSANQVNKEYKEKHDELPEKPIVTSYSISAPKQVVRGNNVSVNSSITVVDGRKQSVDHVEEKLYIVNSDGERKQIKSKEAKNSGMDQGGEYENSFSFTPPTGVAQGNYRLESEVYVNDKLAKTAQTPIVLAHNANNANTIALNQ